MFLLNNNLKFIEANEPNVLAVHRSSAAIFFAPESQKQQMCDAYLCVVRENGAREQVYVAINLSLSKDTLVYTADPSLQPVTTSTAVQNALSFLSEMGFHMENCNLEGSPALRAVVLHGVKVLRAPGTTPAKSALESSPKAAPPAPQPGPELVAAAQSPAEPVVEKAAAASAAQERSVEPGAEISVAGLAELKAELQRVREEKDALAAASAGRIAELEGNLAAARAELAQLCAERAEAAAAPSEDEQAAIRELASLQDDYEALRSEYSMINDELTDRHSDLQQLRSEIISAQEAAADEIEILKATIVRLSAEHMKALENGSAAQQAWPPQDLNRDESAIPSYSGLGWHDAVGNDKLQESAFQGFGTSPPVAASRPSVQELKAVSAAGAPALFHHDPSLSCVPCQSTDDVIDLRVSFNTIRMICGGATAQNCSAYICGIERAGAREVYVALYLTEDRKSMIYAPEQQPSDAEEYSRAMDGAVSFADVVGFIINLEYLGGGAAARAKIFRQIPVLGRS
jgi:DNA-binding XRE family transcriptional regulator